MGDDVMAVDDASFQHEVLESDLPVLVDFWAPWCGPCRMVGPIVEELAAAYAGRLKVVKLNVDDSSQTAATYGVAQIPTLGVFTDGKMVESSVGALPKKALENFVSKHL